MRILIAEDEVATAKALKLLLEKAKYSVDIVHNGNDAWSYISSDTYEVIVLDIMMPGMTGLEVLSLIRQNHITTPVLILTAKAEIEDKEYQLIELFVLHPGFVFSTEHLMDRIWGFESDSDIDVVWTHIGFVRKKLRSIGANVEIKTIRGSGYSLEVEKC